MRHGLVLGGGGLVGMGYHAGVLKALEDIGADAAATDLVIGTSAGAVIGSYLASGWETGDFYAYGIGEHPDSSPDPNEHRRETSDVFVPLWRSPAERLRRGVGSLFAAAASRGYYRAGGKGRVPHRLLRRAFPSGLYSTERTRERLHEDLPQKWPERPVYLCAADLYRGKRVAFGLPEAPTVPYPDAVLASTAIPGVFPPVRIGDRYYVDGGIVTATSLDLAVDAGCESILCIAPLGYRVDEPALSRHPKMWGPMLVRSLFARSLRREVKDARSKGVDVFVVRPLLSELKEHGTNSMRYYDRVALIEAAREATRSTLEEHKSHPAVAALLTKRKERDERWSEHSTG